MPSAYALSTCRRMLTLLLIGYSNDFVSSPDSVTGPRPPVGSRRKQTLMTLLDALNELTRDEDLSHGALCVYILSQTIIYQTTDTLHEPSFEDDHDVRECIYLYDN